MSWTGEVEEEEEEIRELDDPYEEEEIRELDDPYEECMRKSWLLFLEMTISQCMDARIGLRAIPALLCPVHPAEDLQQFDCTAELARLDRFADLITDSEYSLDFLWSPIVAWRFMDVLFAAGYLPMGYDLNSKMEDLCPDMWYAGDDWYVDQGVHPFLCPDMILLPKLHCERCVLHPLRSSLHISKNAKKKSKRYYMTFNKDFNGVVAGCNKQHGKDSWLLRFYVLALRDIFEKSEKSRSRVVSVEVYVKNVQKKNGIEIPGEPHPSPANAGRGDRLVAGELGVLLGRVYTSLTGFHCENSAGSVQLASLGAVLAREGCELWDLGMSLPYKASIGARMVDRREFLNLFRSLRDQPCGFQQTVGRDERFSCDDLIRSFRSIPQREAV